MNQVPEQTKQSALNVKTRELFALKWTPCFISKNVLLDAKQSVENFRLAFFFYVVIRCWET